MKKLLTFLGIFSLAVFFFGCEEEPTDPDTLAPPTNLTLAVAGSDSLSLKLSWDASTDTVDGYLVYFEGDVIDTVAATKSLTYTDTPTALGEYKIKAYKGSKLSDPVTESSELEEDTNQGEVYWTGDTNPDHPSGYGWVSDGTGKAYSLTSGKGWTNTDKVDFVLDYYDKKSTLMIRSPDDYNTAFDHTTGVAHNISWTYDIAEAPVGYGNYEDVVDGGTYVLWVHGKYYVKMKVTATATDITFKYGFQKIAGFRRLK